jgi:uncharacterized protein YjdB
MSFGDCRRYKSIRVSLSCLSLLLLAAGMGCGGSSSLAPGGSTKALTSIAASPGTASIAVGATEQFNAMATYNDGSTANVTASATWTNTDPKVATINPSGDAKAIAAGSTTVTATLDGVSGTATLTVDAAAKTLTAIAVSPATASIAAGATQQFTAKATYSDSSIADVTATVAWTTSNAAVAKINAAGLATAQSSGSVTVTATLDSVSGSATVTVPVAVKTLTSIALSPGTISIAAKTTQQFAATATYSDGSKADVTGSVAWTTASPAVATINASGLATAVAAGSTAVTASLNGVTGTATLTVTHTLSSISVSPNPQNLVVGATQQFSALATYSDGATQDITATATWTAAVPTVATVNAAGLATALAPGTTAITASLSGVIGSATLNVPRLTSIAVTPNPVSIAAGATQQFTATASYSDGSTQNITAKATWTSSNPAAGTVNAAGLATAVAAGSTSITASLNGITGSTTLTVTPILSSIAVTPNPVSIAIGATQQFTATAKYSDGSTKDVTATAAWTSTTPAAATVNSAGLATGVATGSTNITATLNSISGSATLNVTSVTISVTPNSTTIDVGATQQFTATATYPNGSTADVTATVIWSIVNPAVATIDATTGLATAVAVGSTTVTASLNGSSGNASLAVTLPAATGVNIPTWHVDNNRSGLNAHETSLTPTNVGPSTFGKLFSLPIDGYAYAEPLLMSNITINGAKHNVLYVATENDSVYAFDADTKSAPLWQVSLLQSNETPLTGATVKPVQGVTSTPVIDPSSNTIYVVSAQKSSANGASYRLNALDITTGAQKFNGPVTITASVPGTNSTAVNGNVSLPPGCVQRAALLLSQGTLYIGVGSCHSGWLLSYDAKTLTQTGVFNSSPNIDGEGTYGGAGGVWMGSGGPVADSAGNVYISTGNGPWNPAQGSYGDSILKFSPTLQLLDYFTPEDYGYMNCEDSDLAAGGLLMIPGSGQVIGGGKMGRIYLLNTAKMGNEQAMDAGVVQRSFVEQGVSGSQPYPSSCTDSDAHGNPLPNGKTWYVGGPNDSNGDTANGINSYEIFGTSAYFNGSIYLGVTPTTTNAPVGVVRRFSYAAPGVLTSQEFTSLNLAQQQPENTRGTTPFISANGTNDGILWTIDQGQPLQTPDPGGPTNATLYAYDATNLSNELYSSSTNSVDQPGYGIKFTSPIVANGKVYISTGHDLTTAASPQGEIDVYGLK